MLAAVDEKVGPAADGAAAGDDELEQDADRVSLRLRLDDADQVAKDAVKRLGPQPNTRAVKRAVTRIAVPVASGWKVQTAA